MIIVKVKKGDRIDKYLKQFKKKFDKLGVIKEVRRRSQFVKKSVKRRNEIIKAQYSNKMRILSEMSSR